MEGDAPFGSAFLSLALLAIAVPAKSKATATRRSLDQATEPAASTMLRTVLVAHSGFLRQAASAMWILLD